MSSVRVVCPECGEEIDVEFVARSHRGRFYEIEFADDGPRCSECRAGLDECQLEIDAAEALV